MLLEKIHTRWGMKEDISHLKQIPHSCCTCCNTFLLAAKSHRLAHVFCTHWLWLGFSSNMLLEVVSYCFSLLFLFLHHRLNITNYVFIKWLQCYFFSWDRVRDFCVIFSSNMYEQGLTAYHRGIGREMRQLALLSKCLIVPMLFYINFAANGLLCWGTRLHYETTTHSWETQLCSPPHSPVSSVWGSPCSLSHSQTWWAKRPCPLAPWFVDYLWFVSPVGSGKLQGLKWTSCLVATVPAVLGVCLLPSHRWQAGGKHPHLQLQSSIHMAWRGEGMWGLPSFAAICTQTRKRGVQRLGELAPCRGSRHPPRQGSSGNQSSLQATCRPQSIPRGCVQHGIGMFPNSKSQNVNFQPRNGLKWGW